MKAQTFCSGLASVGLDANIVDRLMMRRGKSSLRNHASPHTKPGLNSRRTRLRVRPFDAVL
jgi:hypothetical protein